LTANAAEAYRARFRRVLDHIDAQLGGELTVEALSAVAAFSKHHFHRQFSELFGIGVYEYVRMVRLKRASYLLAFRDDRIIDVALDSGYDSHEAFSRAFKRTIGQTPSEFRERPQWAPWHAAYRRVTDMRSEHMKPSSPRDVNIVDFPETRVAALEVGGDPDELANGIRRFIEWRKQNRLPPRLSATFNIVHDQRGEGAPGEHRFDLCAATDRGVPDNPLGVVEKTIPGGRCAVLRHIGSDDTLPDTVKHLYATWLPASGEELRDFPLYFQRISFFPDVPEHEAVTDVFLPLR
jgi:AraC family transcriptional regulator